MATLISRQTIEIILAFAPPLSAVRGKNYRDPQVAKAVALFVTAMHESGFMIIGYDWQQAFAGERKHELQDAGLLETASPMQLREIMTAQIRADRFCEGHLAALIQNGYIAGFIRRLKALRKDFQENDYA